MVLRILYRFIVTGLSGCPGTLDTVSQSETAINPTSGHCRRKTERQTVPGHPLEVEVKRIFAASSYRNLPATAYCNSNYAPRTLPVLWKLGKAADTFSVGRTVFRASDHCGHEGT